MKGCKSLQKRKDSRPVRSTTSSHLWISLGVASLALALRWPHLSQSLWLDEMTTAVDYVFQPWQKVLAARPGEYVPNNHVLHTILVKLVHIMFGPSGDSMAGPNEALLRLPALFAGCLLPIALAWPLRQTAPRMALSIALLAAVHPWLIAFSTEARGYSLVLLLGVVATHLLPDGRRRWPIAYAITMAAAIYTVPIALLLLAAHGVVVVTSMIARHASHGRAVGFPAEKPTALPWDSFRTYFRGAALVLLLAALLHLPMLLAIVQYYRRPFETTITYRELLDQLPRFALAGERLPRRLDPVLYLPDPPAGSVYWALPVFVTVVGSVFSRKRSELQPALITFGLATILCLLLALVSPAATEVRFVPWIALWFILAMAGLLASPSQRWARGLATLALVLLLAWMGWRDALILPNQPVREAIARADQIAAPGRRILLIYLGAMESAILYGGEASAHEIGFAHDMSHLIEAENRALIETGNRPWLVMGYEDLARRRNNGGEETRGMWTHLQRNYRLITRLPGRITPMAIYAPRDASVVVRQEELNR